MMPVGLIRSAVTLGLSALICGLPGDRWASSFRSADPLAALTAADFGIEQLSETEWRISTAKISQSSRQSLWQLVWMLENGFKPLTEEGRLVGYRIGGIDRSPLFQEMGLRNGDVIRLFNGTPITSFYDMRLRFANSGSVKTIGVERNGTLVTLSYRFE